MPRERDSAKSVMSQDVTSQQAKTCNEYVEHEYALRKFETLETEKQKNMVEF